MSAHDDRRWVTLIRRWLTPAGNAVNVAVTAAATTKSVVFARVEQDAAYGVSVTANWQSTIAVTSKTVSGFTLTFGTAAPANATVDLAVFRSE